MPLRNYPRLRESVKAQFAAKMDKAMAKVDTSNPFAAMGAAIGMGLANVMVEAMVSPEAVMKAMADGKLGPQISGAPPPMGSQGKSGAPEPQWNFERAGVDKIVSYVVDAAHPEQPNAERVGFVFERTGFAHWKLTEVRLPHL